MFGWRSRGGVRGSRARVVDRASTRTGILPGVAFPPGDVSFSFGFAPDPRDLPYCNSSLRGSHLLCNLQAAGFVLSFWLGVALAPRSSCYGLTGNWGKITQRWSEQKVGPEGGRSFSVSDLLTNPPDLLLRPFVPSISVSDQSPRPFAPTRGGGRGLEQ